MSMLKGWRTVAVNVVAALPVAADILLAFAAEGGGDLIPDRFLPYYTVAILLVNVYLRTITTTPVGRKE